LLSKSIEPLVRNVQRVSPYKVLVVIYSTFLKRKFHSCGRNIRIHPPALINTPGKIDIGNDVSIGRHCWLNCLPESKNSVALTIGSGCSIGRFGHINAYEHVVLEDHVLIADRVHISDCTHNFMDCDVPIILQGATFQGAVIIKRGAWVGTGAVIFPGVTIGRNAVVGANAVVNQDVPDNHIAVGVPARIIEKRKRQEPACPREMQL